jgi:hypothetical protein
LLIPALRRGDRDAALFYRQDGRPQPEFGFGFPFDAKKFAGGEIRWSRLWPTAALVVRGTVAIQVTWNSRGTASADSSSAAEVTARATASTYDAPCVGHTR